ncbi:DUF1178 family protein [Rhodocyclus tenuis]|uniref:DUF1178 family protein n=1 Tax=Rhodocyclus tenuis TaxID=1066 RepID=UPI001902F09B|nr:DUF1178 family protein [Rhodocyclus tenuis]MBK1678924.1 hypothetical protein [Rhodocyclus tenuis]
MIIFDLVCAEEHRFEGWFHSADDFTRQLSRGLVLCPHCDSASVRRLPSALHLGKVEQGDAAKSVPVSASAPDAPGNAPKVPGTAGMRQVFEALLAGCEDVGTQFTEEVRRIHYAEAPIRPIRGEASQDDYESLRDEGIDVCRLPLLPKKTLS